MTHTIHITTAQAQSLKNVFLRYLYMAEKSQNLAFLIGLESADLIRVKSILDSLPKIVENGNVPRLSSDLPPAYPVYRANDPTPTVADPSAAHGDH
jgi:hypothetical protein